MTLFNLEVKHWTVRPPQRCGDLFDMLMDAHRRAADDLGFSFYTDPNYAYAHPEISAALDAAMSRVKGEVHGRIIVQKGQLMFELSQTIISAKGEGK